MSHAGTLPPLQLILWSSDPVDESSASISLRTANSPATRLELRPAASEADKRQGAARLLNFGELLVRRRKERSCEGHEIVLCAEEPSVPCGWVAIPHVYAWQSADDVRVVWEAMQLDRAEAIFDAPADAVARWARHSEDVLWLARQSRVASLSGEHLSFRWIVRNEKTAASLISARGARFHHVSIHVEQQWGPRIRQIFTDVLGLVEISRPSSITTDGHWLQCGEVAIHLSTRAQREEDVSFPGTAPNHLCFSVGDLAAAAAALTSLDVRTTRAGSLGNQLWFHLPGGTTVELQQRDLSEPIPSAGRVRSHGTEQIPSA